MDRLILDVLQYSHLVRGEMPLQEVDVKRLMEDVIANFPDLPNGWSQGETRDEALAQAEDLLVEMILGRMAHNEVAPRRRRDARSWLCRP